MDLKELGKKIAKYGAPLLGAAVGGPGGAAIGAAVGSLFGGEEEPDRIAAAMAADPNAMLKLKELELNSKVELQKIALDHARIASQERQKQLEEETAQLAQVNATIRDEGKSEHWPQYSWRPFWGFSSGTAFLAVCWFVCRLADRAVTAGDVSAMNMIPQVIGSFVPLFGIAGAVLGVAVWGRNRLKEARVGKQDHIADAGKMVPEL